MKKKASPPPAGTMAPKSYDGLFVGIRELLDASRHATARVVNSLMTATYWDIGRRIVEHEQGGKKRAGYGDELLKRLAEDLTAQFGRGFGARNLSLMKQLYLGFPNILQTLSAKLRSAETLPTLSEESELSSITSTPSRESTSLQIGPTLPDPILVQPAPLTLAQIAKAFPLPWSHYVLLLKARSPEAREFYHTEALRGGWSVRQLDRQMSSLFYERMALSKNKAAMLKTGAKAKPGEELTATETLRDPLVLEFLDLKDEYSETELEAALIQHLETFLLELGGDFTFVGRQRRLRIDDEWYRVDLVFFHRRLRSLVIFDLKLGRFTHADAGQMHLYLSYAQEHWAMPGENPPVGIILCTTAGQGLVHYTLDTLPTKVMAREYRLALPDEKKLLQTIQEARQQVERAAHAKEVRK
jgi:predicted nuclease of restriction endonuclease-like (RecB) superfamily